MVLKKNGLPPDSSYTTIDYISKVNTPVVLAFPLCLKFSGREQTLDLA
jgi:hypothetical protein